MRIKKLIFILMEKIKIKINLNGERIFHAFHGQALEILRVSKWSFS